ncbi:MAG: transketolase [Brevinematales bacterium]|nr:transketolase [Brevinematales bacterium]
MVGQKLDVEKLKQTAREVREKILIMTHEVNSGHPGGSMSLVEIMLSLYFYKLKYDPKNPDWDDRDRVIISKGHATPVVYLTLAKAGFFKEEDLMKGFRRFGHIFQGHVCVDVPGIEFNTGSLGQGLSAGIGMALGARYKKKDYSVYVILGDGEVQEGSIWEAAMFASHHRIENLCAIIDYNKVQENGFVNDILSIEPLKDRWESFGWNYIEIDGHNFNEIFDALDAFTSSRGSGKPTIIVANTVKGKGVSFMEYKHTFHGRAPNKEELDNALKELKGGNDD